jgi:DNA polymerase-2
MQRDAMTSGIQFSRPDPRGFVLQSTYQIEHSRPVILIYGRLEGGGSFLVRDTRQIPCFHILAEDAGRARALGAPIREEEPPKRTFAGEPVVRVEVRVPQDVPALRDSLTARGINTYEADVPFATRFLIERGIRGGLGIRGSARPGDGIDSVFENPEVEPADWTPELSTLSIDIETDPEAKHLLSVALASRDVSEVLLYSPKGYPTPAGAHGYPSEKELLEAFVRRVRDLDPDIITGWNVVEFDLAVLLKIAGRLGVPLSVGRGPKPLRLRSSNFARSPNQALVAGRVVLDGIDLLRGAFVRLENYSLDAVAREVVGKGKTYAGPNRPEEIVRMFKQDRARFVEYNLNDARLALEILDAMNLVQLAVERSRLTGMPPDRVAASIASFDFLYLSELSRRGIVAPTVSANARWETPTSGGHVLDPLPGLYRNVLVFDFRSLYPNIIRTFQIDPLGCLDPADSAESPILAPNGAAFRRSQGILPAILDDLFPRRERAIAAGDRVAATALKILMNSFYGVLGTPACRFASPDLANAITGFGREILLWSKAAIESYGYRVLYGDTDSLFVLSGIQSGDDARELGRKTACRLNSDLSDHIRSTWNVESKLELRFERLYLRLLLPAVRHGTAGARKRYAGLIEEQGQTEVVFTGMESVRSDWTDLAKQVQREIYLRLFNDQPVDDYLREVVKELRAGQLDSLLIYRKSIRKDLDAYVASTPPHVAAARKMTRRHGSVVAYVITRDGPEPADERRAPIDYEHYVQKQIRAVSEPVLGLLGVDFESTISKSGQMSLF